MCFEKIIFNTFNIFGSFFLNFRVVGLHLNIYLHFLLFSEMVEEEK